LDLQHGVERIFIRVLAAGNRILVSNVAAGEQPAVSAGAGVLWPAIERLSVKKIVKELR